MKIATVQNSVASVFQDRHVESGIIFHSSDSFRLDRMGEKKKKHAALKVCPHLLLC